MSEKTKRRRLSFKEKYELIKEVKAGALKEFLLNKYCITDRMYNRMIENEPEDIYSKSEKLRIREEVIKNKCQY